MDAMTEADIQHLEDVNAPISDDERAQAAAEIRRLRALIHNPHTEEFLSAVQYEAAYQRVKWGDAHDRSKSADQWFWLVGYLSGKCLRAVITGHHEKALHHTVSSAAALANWFEAIKRDETGSGLGADHDIKPAAIVPTDGADENESIETSEREGQEA